MAQFRINSKLQGIRTVTRALSNKMFGGAAPTSSPRSLQIYTGSVAPYANALERDLRVAACDIATCEGTEMAGD